MGDLRQHTRRAAFLLASAMLLAATTLTAQTIISNETLVTTTLAIDKTQVIATCSTAGCSAKAPLLTSIPVTCPNAIGATCTFHISLDAGIIIALQCGGVNCLGSSGSSNYYQFLVDGVAPVPGPTDTNGNYIFSEFVASDTLFPSAQSYRASVAATVTNTSSQNHTVTINFGCTDKEKFYGCGLTAHQRVLRVDVFEP